MASQLQQLVEQAEQMAGSLDRGAASACAFLGEVKALVADYDEAVGGTNRSELQEAGDAMEELIVEQQAIEGSLADGREALEAWLAVHGGTTAGQGFAGGADAVGGATALDTLLRLGDEPVSERGRHQDEVPVWPSERPSLVDQRRGELEWVPESGDEVPEDLNQIRAGTDPAEWAHLVNREGRGWPGRDVNCVDCARAAESTWRGRPACSAALADSGVRGTSRYRISEWVNGEWCASSFKEVRRRLEDLGHGSSALVASRWASGRGGHAYGAVNYRGKVLFVDAQVGRVCDWPSKEGDIGWPAVSDVQAIFCNPNGYPE